MENDVTVIQNPEELEAWHSSNDPWGYESNPQDELRKNMLLAELPQRPYRRVLDVGCGQGFITRDLPGEEVIGVDISASAVEQAKRNAAPHVRYLQASVFDLPEKVGGPFDLIVVTGVLYPQYVGRALGIVYRNLVGLLADGGLLASVHIDAWYEARFPLLRLREHYYPYRQYIHRLELYIK